MSLPLLDITDIGIMFGFATGVVIPPTPLPPTIVARGNFEPFDDVMWPDRMRIVRVRRAMSGGSEQKYYDAQIGPEIECRARPRSITLQNGRTQTVWDVRTPLNYVINMDDMLKVVDPSGQLRKLVAEGPSVPKAAGFSYLTECTERK